MTDDNNKPFKLYRASAGSGKTYTLVKEFITLCLQADEKYYKEILAVTFTNKAANDMKVKILNNLKGIINNEPSYFSMLSDLKYNTNLDDDTIKEKAKNIFNSIIHNYSDFSISTIDSFVQQISRSFHKELNLPYKYKMILDDDDLLDNIIIRLDKKIGKDQNKDIFLTEILTEFIEFQLDNESSWRIEDPIRDFVKKLLKENSYKKGELFCENNLNENQYIEIKNYLKNKSDYILKSIKDNINVIDNHNNTFSLQIEDFYYSSRGLPSILMKLEEINNIGFDIIQLQTDTVKKILQSGIWYSSKISKEKIKNILDSKTDIIQPYINIINDYSDYQIINILRKNLFLYILRGKLLYIIGEIVEETNKVHISEFNKRISDIIGDCSVPFIYERLGSRYKNFFIDEFQDTSLLQWFNFLPLINNSLSNADVNLLVGDAKQAIYRFRSGEVEQIIKLPDIYLKPDTEFANECESTFKNNISIKNLEVNYRSKKNIVEFNNSFFDYSCRIIADESYKSVYQNNMKQKVNKGKENEYNGCVRVEIFKVDEIAENDKSENLLSNKKKYKLAVMNSMTKQINDLIKIGFQFKDITILVRNNADGSEIAEFLSEKDIPVISTDSISLKSSDKVLLIIQTLRCLVDNDNPVKKLTLSFYHELSKQNVPVDDILEKALKTQINDEFLDVLRNNILSLYDLCVKIIKMFNFSIIKDVFLQYFMNLVGDWQNSENGGIEAFLDYWDRKSDKLYVTMSGEYNAVNVMTIHKSKGLEFKIVMYPYAFTKLPEKFKGNEKWMSCDSEDFIFIKDMPYIDKFILPINKKLIGTKYEKFFIEEYNKAVFDDFNIMYVAMTRPEDMLFIYTDNIHDDEKKLKNNVIKENFSNNLFVDYFNINNDAFVEETNISSIYQIGNISFDKNKLDNHNENVFELDSNDLVDTINWTDQLRIDPDPSMFWSDNDELLPQEWGNLVHAILSKINTIEDAEMALKPYVYDGCIDEKQSEKLLHQFETIVNHNMIKSAFSKEAKIKNEMEVLTAYGKILRPDRFVELPDKVIVIDYKTGKKDESHYEQLSNYVAVIKEMITDKDIEAFLVYIGENIDVQQVFFDRLF